LKEKPDYYTALAKMEKEDTITELKAVTYKKYKYKAGHQLAHASFNAAKGDEASAKHLTTVAQKRVRGINRANKLLKKKNPTHSVAARKPPKPKTTKDDGRGWEPARETPPGPLHGWN